MVLAFYRNSVSKQLRPPAVFVNIANWVKVVPATPALFVRNPVPLDTVFFPNYGFWPVHMCTHRGWQEPLKSTKSTIFIITHSQKNLHMEKIHGTIYWQKQHKIIKNVTKKKSFHFSCPCHKSTFPPLNPDFNPNLSRCIILKRKISSQLFKNFLKSNTEGPTNSTKGKGIVLKLYT